MRHPIKVVAISHAYVRSINRNVFGLVAELGCDVHVLAPESIESGKQEILCEPHDLPGVTLHRLPIAGTHLRRMKFVRLERLLKEISPDVIFVEADPVSKTVLDLTRFCRKYEEVSLICLTNENLNWKFNDALRRTGLRGLPALIVKMIAHRRFRSQIDHVFTTSKYAQKIFEQAGYPSVSFLPLGFDSTNFRYCSKTRCRIRKQEDIGSDEIVISYFGRISKEKGVTDLISALGRLKAYSWRLFLNDFVSNSEYSDHVSALIRKLGIEDRVHTVRSQHGLISEWMCASDITVLPSHTTSIWVEQFGRVVTEAMATGNYVVVSDSGTPKELVGDTGKVFPEGDQEALADCLANFLKSPANFLLDRKAAIRRAQRNFDISAQARKMVTRFEQTCVTKS